MSDGEEFFEDTDRGYDGTREPIQLADIDYVGGLAVINGALRHGRYTIRAEGMGVLVVETAPPE